MTEPTRREFLTRSTLALSGVALSGCSTPEWPEESEGVEVDVLGAVAEAVLPRELGGEGIDAALNTFRGWLSEYEPVSELVHGYGTSEVEYGPADPGPRWTAQLQALEIEAQKRHDRGFATLSLDERRKILRQRIRDEGDDGPGLPHPVKARHVSVALVAHWFATAAATDRAYGARIGRDTCRPLDRTPERPERRGESS
ncbi:MAG: gluconate 2-dehydrogenase subunit 3 family protein [Gemmatimonadetes bacterium]|nr:gluconate 2-dehydrogenase subunit 3 family protein [Gemmatimonadota bacterium]